MIIVMTVKIHAKTSGCLRNQESIVPQAYDGEEYLQYG